MILEEYFERETPISTNALEYYYDESGICAINYNGQNYHFQKNAFGDVVRIFGWDGFPVSEYVYDAWGNCKAIDLNGVEIVDSSHIANVNPFRYRGYYFDTETGFYYLESRYYNPKTCRFITPDEIKYLDPMSVGGLNLYTYCNNNPVMYKERSILFKKARSSLHESSHNTNKYDGNMTKQMDKEMVLSESNKFNLFGYEHRISSGWNNSPTIATSWFGRFGVSSYVTKKQGVSGVLYAFAGSTTDAMNWFGTTYYAGVGINLFDVVGVEVQLETLGVGAQLNIGDFSLSFNVNLIGGVSITVGWNKNIGNGQIKTEGFTVGINTGVLVAAVLWFFKLIATGDASPLPGLSPV